MISRPGPSLKSIARLRDARLYARRTAEAEDRRSLREQAALHAPKPVARDAEGAIRDDPDIRLARQDEGRPAVLGRDIDSTRQLRRAEFSAFDGPRNFAAQGSRRSAQEDGAVRRRSPDWPIAACSSPRSAERSSARAAASAVFAVLYLDLDHFKDVNDTLGHPIGDRLLQAVAERLQANVRTSDTLARLRRRRVRPADDGHRRSDGCRRARGQSAANHDQAVHARRQPDPIRGQHRRRDLRAGRCRTPKRCSPMRTSRFIGRNRKAGIPIGSSPARWMRKCANAWP